MSFFDINSLVDDALIINDKKHTIYEKLLFKVYKKIKIMNKKKKFQLLYEVPNYVFGHALYDLKTCIAFIMVALRKKGITVRYVNPNILVISWKQLIEQQYKKMVQQGLSRQPVSNNSQSTFNSINMIKTVNINGHASDFQGSNSQKTKNNVNYKALNENLIKGYNTVPTNNQKISSSASEISLTDIFERAKYL
jgi:hypothetical protein